MIVRGRCLAFVAGAIIIAMPAICTAQGATVARGRYLAIAADCTACHTRPATADRAAGRPFAGGEAIVSPLGTIVSSNITPSRAHGIGGYTEAQFAAALRKGVRADGARLYPAMPYTAYTLLSDADIHALYSYFMQGVAPVEADPPRTDLPFPFNIRASMLVWNALFLRDHRFATVPDRDAQWNRGAYLVEALEHCSACHSPRGFLMQEERGKAYSGGAQGEWRSPNITADPVAGIGGWSREDLVRYLMTGQVAGRGQAAGGMADAVSHSLSHLDLKDVEAIAAYVATIPAQGGNAIRPASAWGAPSSLDYTLRGSAAPLSDGGRLYSGLCASCHGPAGAGSRDQAFPSLFHNSTVGDPQPNNLLAVILEGVDRDVGSLHVGMPGFGTGSFVQPLTDGQVAAVATFVRASFGPGGTPVTADMVATARRGGPAPALLTVTRIGVPAAIVAVLGLVAWLIARRRNRRREVQS